MFFHHRVHAFHAFAYRPFHSGILSHSLHDAHHLILHLHHFVHHLSIFLIQARVSLLEQGLRGALRMLLHQGFHTFHPLGDLLFIGTLGHPFHHTHHVLHAFHHFMHHLLILLIQTVI